MSIQTKECEYCSKDFVTSQSRAKFCSRKCYGKHYYAKKQNRDNRIENHKQCLNCGNLFIAHRVDKTFCSKDCQWDYRYKTKVKKNTELKCERCGATFVRKSSNHKFCSKNCKGVANATKYYNKYKWHYKQVRRDDGTYVSEHRYVVEQRLKRLLQKNEIVHHIDLDKSNNEEYNLHLFDKQQDHGCCHWSLNSMVRELIDKNIIQFDSDKGIYTLLE